MHGHYPTLPWYHAVPTATIMSALCAYELERLENIRCNEAQLEKLGLHTKLIPRKANAPKQPKRKANADPDWQPRVTRARTGSNATVVEEEDSEDDDGDDEETKPKKRDTKLALPRQASPRTTTERHSSSQASQDDTASKCVVVEPAKTGRSTCRGCMEPIAAGELRVGMESWMVGRNIVVWQHPKCFLAKVGVAEEVGGRGKCKQTKEAFAAGERSVTLVAHTTTARVKLAAAGALLAPVLAAAGRPQTVAALSESAENGALASLSAKDAHALEASLLAKQGEREEVVGTASELLGVAATPSTMEALAAGKEKRQPAAGTVVKATGKVAWKWAGQLCYGTLLPSSETKSHCYARTQKGNTKTLTKTGDYWWQL